MDPLIAKSVRRFKIALVIAVLIGVSLATADMAGTNRDVFWLVLALVPLSLWVAWPANVWHHRQRRLRRDAVRGL